ncbi:MAG TPA: HAD-IC family P-type ATPase, partial [Thermoanaerobaculia bacterium]|nr:HAD-IC family P-type ATPase [Thermoanaerobaculia bacterium]
TALIRVTRAGESSTAGEVQRLLERGLASRPAAAELADRLSGWIVGVVLVVSASTAAWWSFHDPSRALAATVAVLIVTCPCALALATPIGLTLAAARLARAGVLPARMSAIEPLARADSAVFDKTGTLTLLSPRLAALETFGGLDEEDACSIAAALERDSFHPIAKALGAAVGDGVPSASEVDHAPGRGVCGEVERVRWWLGSPGFAAGGAGVSLPAHIETALAAARREGNPAALLLDGAGRGALFIFSEDVRPGGADVVASLRAEGIRRFALLSGDPGEAAARLGASLGFDEARAAISPETKLEWVRERQETGARLLFVGDGLNDAPALAAADVSMSFTQAPQISRLACDFLIARRDLGAVVDARRIARRTRRLLVQNVGWAVAYNVVSIPLAAAGLVPPWAAALGMSASSLLVVANAMRLGSAGVSDARASVRLADARR